MKKKAGNLRFSWWQHGTKHLSKTWDSSSTPTLTHTHIHLHTPTHTHKPYSITSHHCSPCNDIRRKAHHKCTDECTDFFGGPPPPPLLFIQAFLAYTAKAHRYNQISPKEAWPETCTHNEAVQRENMWGRLEGSSILCTVIPDNYIGEFSQCQYKNYVNREQFNCLIRH